MQNSAQCFESTCFKCGSKLELGAKVGFKECCPKCDSDLHCCKNCLFFDANAYNSCRESQAERVVDKERFNHCEYFSIGIRNRPAPSELDQNKASARNSLDDLFKK